LAGCRLKPMPVSPNQSGVTTTLWAEVTVILIHTQIFLLYTKIFSARVIFCTIPRNSRWRWELILPACILLFRRVRWKYNNNYRHCLHYEQVLLLFPPTSGMYALVQCLTVRLGHQTMLCFDAIADFCTLRMRGCDEFRSFFFCLSLFWLLTAFVLWPSYNDLLLRGIFFSGAYLPQKSDILPPF
jgi:hypothetical protein